MSREDRSDDHPRLAGVLWHTSTRKFSEIAACSLMDTLIVGYIVGMSLFVCESRTSLLPLNFKSSAPDSSAVGVQGESDIFWFSLYMY